MIQRLTAKKILQYGSVSAVIILVLGYGIWISRDLLFGIHYTVTGISDGMNTQNATIEFSGVAAHANTLVVDGRTIPLAEDGTWTDTLALLPGYNTIQIQVTDKFKRVQTKEYRVYYKQ